MQKVVLIIPPSPWLMSDRDQPMMGILYISSWLKLHSYVDVQVCDLSSIPEKYWHIPIGDIYGITGVTPQFVYMKKIIDKLKEREPEKLVVVGGVHATVLPHHLLENTKVDICVVGEGEIAMQKIVDGEWLRDIPGIIIKGLDNTPGELIQNLDRIPYPDRDSIDYFEYMKPDTYEYLDKSKEGSIITSRGCPYKCSYCASYKIHSGKVRFRSAENVYDELASMKRKYGIGLCNFVDDTFIINKERVKKICKLIMPLGIKWFFLTRVDHVDLDLFKIMKDAGCVSVTFGFESGSNRMLKFLHKNTTVEQAYNAIDISLKTGFKIRGQLMVGLPSETEKDVELTAEFIKKTKGDITKFGIHVFQPIPGCDIWENPDSYEYKLDKNTNFENYHTIGKTDINIINDKIKSRFEYLRCLAGVKNIDKK